MCGEPTTLPDAFARELQAAGLSAVELEALTAMLWRNFKRFKWVDIDTAGLVAEAYTSAATATPTPVGQ